MQGARNEIFAMQPVPIQISYKDPVMGYQRTYFIFTCFNKLSKMDLDIFNTWPLCNMHTTRTDILWAGLPMVNLPLEKVATRAAGSLCLAIGVGAEMIASR
ncbi:hypothetical protein UlMin_026324 [Ulmus minor]